MAEPLEIVAAIEAHARPTAAPAARRPARARHLRPDPRADRSGALSRQPLLRPAGPCHRRGRCRGRRARDAGLAARSTIRRSAGRRRSSMSRRRARCWQRSRRRCPPTSPSWRRRSPTGGRRARRAARSRRTAAAGRRALALVENPDILATRRPSRDSAAGARHRLRRRDRRPPRQRAAPSCKAKGADWILANDVSPATGVMGGDENTVHLVARGGRRGLADARQGRGRASGWSRGSPTALHAQGTRRRGDAVRSPGAPACRTAPGCRCRHAALGSGRRPRPPRRGRRPIAAGDPPGGRGAGADRLRDRPAGRLRGPGAAALRPRRASTASPSSTRPARSTPTIAAR